MYHIDIRDWDGNRLIHDYCQDIDWMLTAMLEAISEDGIDPEDVDIIIDQIPPSD